MNVLQVVEAELKRTTLKRYHIDISFRIWVLYSISMYSWNHTTERKFYYDILLVA